MTKTKTATDNKPKPYTVLTIVRAESGQWEYEIRISHRTGVTYCTCTGWQFRKTCKHLEAYKADPSFKGGNVPTAPTVDLAMLPRLDQSAIDCHDPAVLLRSLLADLGLRVAGADCERIAGRVLGAAGARYRPRRVGPLAPSNVAINAGNIRVITLPD